MAATPFMQIAGNAGSDENQQGAWLTPWEVSPFNPDWVYIAKDKVYRSTNRGNHWVPLETLPGGDCTGLAWPPMTWQALCGQRIQDVPVHRWANVSGIGPSQRF